MNLLKLHSFTDRPQWVQRAADLSVEVWPQFMLQDSSDTKYWEWLKRVLPDYQFLFTDETGDIVGAGYTVPLAKDYSSDLLPEGWSAVLEQGFRDYQNGLRPSSASALSINIAKKHQGKGLSHLILKEMRQQIFRKGLRALIAPVRPMLKSQFPDVLMEEYLQWKSKEGAPFDPWIRAHLKQGGRMVRIAHNSMKISGTVNDWEKWTGQNFKTSGLYVVSGALSRVSVNLENNSGEYFDPNVWIIHLPSSGDRQ